MRFLPLVLTSFALLACSAKQTPEEEPAPEVKTTNSKPATPAVTEDKPDLPEIPGDSLGLLDPKDITKLPSAKDMRPSVDRAATKAVLATPPGESNGD